MTLVYSSVVQDETQDPEVERAAGQGGILLWRYSWQQEPGPEGTGGTLYTTFYTLYFTLHRAGLKTP